LVAVGGIFVVIVSLTIFAGPVMQYAEATAAQLFDPTPYIETVLRRAGE
jgi:multicomponent K+:H+ antiporter subunit D